MKRIKIEAATTTTVPGFCNGNQQSVVRDTGFASRSFAGQSIYEMSCGRCGGRYGSNGCDIHHRRCPTCQGGRAGERLREPGPGLFEQPSDQD